MSSKIKRVKKRPKSLSDVEVGAVCRNPGSGELVKRIEDTDGRSCSRCCFSISQHQSCQSHPSLMNCLGPNAYYQIVDASSVKTKPPGHDTPIGEVFRDEADGPVLKVEECNGCGGCYYDERGCCPGCHDKGFCRDDQRRDGKDIIFRKVEEQEAEAQLTGAQTIDGCARCVLRIRSRELETRSTNQATTIEHLHREVHKLNILNHQLRNEADKRQEANRTVAEIVAEIKRLRPPDDCIAIGRTFAERELCNNILAFIAKLDPPESMSFAEACEAVLANGKAYQRGVVSRIWLDGSKSKVITRMNPGDEKETDWQLVSGAGGPDGV